MRKMFIIALLFGICFGFETYKVRIAYPFGYLTARVIAPDIARYVDGAPIAVYIPGGHGMGDLSIDTTFVPYGVIFIRYLLPGKSLGSDSTTGQWDCRGIATEQVVATVMAYACGDINDVAGGSMGDSLLVPVNNDVVGMAAYSNGGNLAVTTLGMWGYMFSKVCFVVHYESPTNDQTMIFDFGGTGGDENQTCDGSDLWSFTNDDYKNARYISYGSVECLLDYSNLAWDTMFVDTYETPDGIIFPFRGKAFLDNRTDGRITLNGLGKLDYNNDCTYDTLEDFVFDTYAGVAPEAGWNLRIFYTFPVTQELWNNNILDTLNWPDTVATPSEAHDFWYRRTAVFWFDSIARFHSDFKVILVISQNDHNQTMPDYPNIHQAFDGYSRNGFWVKINPDSNYVREVLPSYSFYYPQNAPNWSPAVWESLYYSAVPEVTDFPIAEIVTAAVLEMCDLCHDSLTIINNDDNSSKPNILNISVKPNPFNSSCKITIFYGRGSARQTPTDIEIYDLRGNVVVGAGSQPAQNGYRAAPTKGVRTFIWTPDQSISSGIYLIRVTMNDGRTITKRALFIK